MYVANFSQAQVDAGASFSICAYLCSVSDIERDAKATGLQESSFFCIKTAYEDASAQTFVAA